MQGITKWLAVTLTVITLLSGLVAQPTIAWAQAAAGEQRAGQQGLYLPLVSSSPSTASTVADAASPLAVTVTASPSPVASGAELTYFITVVNTGGAKVDNVVLTDQINGLGGLGTPPQLVLTSSQGSCTQANLKVTCAAGSLPGGASWTVTIRGLVTAADGTTLNNTVSVTCTKSAQNHTSSATVQTLVQNGTGSPLPDLSISKTGPASVVVSGTLAYLLTVNNTGNANATDIRVVDTLPPGVSLVATSSTSLFVCTSAGTPVTITCDGGAVNQGANATIGIEATAPATAGAIANTAVVDPDNTIAESNELNNTSATVATSVTSGPAVQGLATSIIDSPDPVVPGAILQYTIIVTNIATTRADDVVTVDGTQGLEAASIVASQVIVNGTVGNFGGCVVMAPQVKCTIRTLNPGGTQTITIRGQVVASAGSSILNTATATGNIKNVGVMATASAQTTVKPAVDLTITKADAPDPVCARSWPQPPARLASPPFGLAAAGGAVPTLLAPPGCLGGLTYTIVVGNSGIQPADNVVVRDPLAAGLIFDSYSTDGGFTCAVSPTNIVTCSGGAIPAESIRTITLLLVAPPDIGEISNTITVDPNNAIYEADETNNTFVQATTVSTGIDLVVRKDDSPADPPGIQNVTEGFDPIATSGTQTYVVTVDNVGTQDVTGIRLRDTLPADTIFRAVVADGTHGFTCAHDGAATGGIVECVGGHLLGTASEFYDPAGPAPAGPGDDIATIKIKVFARPTVGTMHNEVRVDPLNEISEYNELNNLATQDTVVTNGGASLSAFNELKIEKKQASPVTGLGDPALVATNGTLVYLLTVTNDATDPAVNIRVRDVLPAGARFIAAVDTVPGPDAFDCSYAAGNVDCIGGTLDGTLDLLGATITQTRQITITVFAPDTPGDYANQSIVDPNNAIPEGNEFNNNATIVTKVRTVGDGGQNAFNELTIGKTQTSPAGTVATSSIVVYEIAVANTGTNPAFNVAVKDTLPAGFTYIEATDTLPGPQAFVCTTAPGNVINCTGATLSGTAVTASGLPTARTIVVKAFTSAVPGSYTNTAIVDPDNAIPEGDETNNMAQKVTQVVVGAGFIDLQITKTGPVTAAPGSMIAYALTVNNAGTDPAFNVKVRDDLPAGTTFVSAADLTGGAGAFACSQAGSSVTCTGGTLDGTDNLIPGPPDVPTSRVIQVKVLAPASIEALALDKGNIFVDIVNQAFVDPENALPESNETNNAAAWTTTIRSRINLKITKDGPTTASQNQEADYTIKVTNETIDGGDTAFDVVVSDPLPIGLIPLSISVDKSNFQCQILENPVNVVSCLGDIATGETVTIKVHVFITANGGPLYNQACVDQDNLIAETNELDNCQTAVTDIVPPAPDLLINKSADASVVTPGQALTYKIFVSNVGNADTTGTVTVTDTLPAQVTLVNFIATNGFTCTGTTTVVCTGASLGIGQSTEIELLTTVTDSVSTSFANSASVSIDGAETNTTNNGPATVTTAVGGSGIDLQVSSITDVPDPANVGDALEYTVIVLNNGTSTAGTVADPAQVRIDLPQNGVTFVGADGTNGFNCTKSGSTVTCDGQFPGGGSTVITVKLSVVAGAPPDLTLVATADPTDKFVETNEGNNTKTEVTTVSGSVCSPVCIDLVLAQVLGAPNPVKVGAIETAKVVVVNVGDTTTAPGNHVKVDITVSGNFSGVPAVAAPAGFACVADAGNIPSVLAIYHCTGDLGPGAGATFNLTMTARAPAGGTITTSANATLTAGAVVPEFTTANNSASYVTNVIP